MDELVLVVPSREVVAAIGRGESWLGIREAPEDRLGALIRHSGEFRPRSEMEIDETWKQVIPYPILRDGDRWFLMRRTKAGGDARLHDRFSIGVGGHVNPDDGGLDGDLSTALRREWREELDVNFVPDFRFVGLLNDDTTPVGRVHVGLVYEGDAAGRPVAIRETDKLSGSFVSAGEVAAVADRLETWSRLAFEFLAPQPATR
ncbi:MAG TPA: NUDIX domain-containing protein [Candidatus Limnocylindrales bacterium]|jgi:predicted NUDIX family phosphoesterase